jgi:hypothetical protein
MKDRDGNPQEEFRVERGWHYRIHENTEMARKEIEKWKNCATAETRFEGKAKSMEVYRSWNKEQMHEELRRHWGTRAERSEMVMKRHRIVQAEFGTGEGWMYELRVKQGVMRVGGRIFGEVLG